jgi:hypothetical protein
MPSAPRARHLSSSCDGVAKGEPPRTLFAEVPRLPDFHRAPLTVARTHARSTRRPHDLASRERLPLRTLFSLPTSDWPSEKPRNSCAARPKRTPPLVVVALWSPSESGEVMVEPEGAGAARHGFSAFAAA